MKIVYFTHSLASCWNHGNAHFLRGIASELVHRGHRVDVYEPRGAWSLANLLDDHGRGGLEPWRRAYPELSSRTHDRDFDIEAAQAGAALVLSDIATFRELWDEAALFVPPDDPAAIATAANALLDDPARAIALGAAARHRAGRYTAEVMAERMLAVLTAAVRSRRDFVAARAGLTEARSGAPVRTAPSTPEPIEEPA